ncbi:50S ribosomal protein L31 [Geothrix limicola]|uniref:Large ribosomal subunit protein bL31 n=1 Tax=Geothrix limicola TaxID=2927978 RepID=A0ABQ5QAE5_9BACT|nr:50S ribosomal protein L31 [Geothrix limicola]GLH71524.1 50S ribosomal protein L31 [Geothrix limicola]
MKENMHPELHDVKVHCACGNEFMTRSTKKELRVEICSNCHPYFTGKQRLMDTEGRVEKFNKKYAKKEAPAAAPEVAAETTEA